jgi:lipoprotein signal peptidase
MTTKTNRSFRWLFWTLAILGLCLDQTSKYGVFGWLSHYPPDQLNDHAVAVIPGVFYLAATFTDHADPGSNWRSALRTLFIDKMPKVNPGALWGIGGGSRDGEGDLNHLFALVSVVAAVAIIVWSFRPNVAHDRWLCVALGLILAGTLGNLYDRLVFLGVRDFLQWVYLYEWPRFNIADSCLVCGAGVLLVHAFFAAPCTQTETASTVAASADNAPI